MENEAGEPASFFCIWVGGVPAGFMLECLLHLIHRLRGPPSPRGEGFWGSALLSNVVITHPVIMPHSAKRLPLEGREALRKHAGGEGTKCLKGEDSLRSWLRSPEPRAAQTGGA